MVMWDEIAAAVAGEFPDATWDRMLVDAMTMRMVLRPQTLDTIVAILRVKPGDCMPTSSFDLVAALAGSLGIAPMASLDPERRFPSMFEPIHGSAFDIAGKAIANPIGTFWSAVLMLEHLGEAAAAARLMRAIERVRADEGLHTPDLGDTATTRQVTEAVVAAKATLFWQWCAPGLWGGAARRIAAILLLQGSPDANYRTVIADTYSWPRG